MTGHIEDNHEHILEEALEQFIASQLWGDKSHIDELVRQYPQFEHQIKQRLQKIQRIDALFDTLVQSDESDFENIQTEQKLVGQKVGGFQITEMIGRGGMGVVYRAYDTKLKRSVAIKSVPAKRRTDLNARALFKREAELLASLNHPNIAVIYDIIERDEGDCKLILEYVPGETLAERITREPLTLEQALSIGQQIAKAISAAHKKGVIHRDLKPGNIKITPDGQVKVLDFGLAKAPSSKDKNGESTATQSGRLIGTPAYMSPEQARCKNSDHRTDIWSFGCIMFQMLAGHLPFEGQTATDTLARVIEREPEWERLPQDTPANIRTLLNRCLEKNIERRFGDIEDAVIEITETLSMPLKIPPVQLRRTAITICVTIIIVLSGVALWFALTREVQPSSKEIRLVVLPFENLGPPEDEYFADGITDEITTRLASIHGLNVISRQSAMQYKKSEKNAQQIAKELGVDYILEGTVQRERPSDPTSRVKIIPQLIQASDDVHVWAQTYEDDMSEVFQAQSDLAERVAQALDITLREPERHALESRPTENIEAYEYYLRGNKYLYRSDRENDIKISIQMYEKAVELETTFALAYTKLAEAHVLMYWYYYDHNEGRLAKAKQAIDTAFQLNPDLPEAHMAMGWYHYQGQRDYERALQEFTIAQKSQPNNSMLLAGVGWVQRRQGRFIKGLTNLEKASTLDPLSNVPAFGVGETLVLLRKYQEAKRYFELCFSLTPDWPRPYSNMASLYLLWEGNTEKARAVLKDAIENIGRVEDTFIVLSSVLIEIFDGKYQEALTQLSLSTWDTFESQFYFIPKAQKYAQIHGLMGNHQIEHKYYESARGILESQIKKDPNDARFHSSLGITYAGLGLKKDALREGKLAVELLPVTKDAWAGTFRIEDLARIYVMVGEFDAAIEQLTYLLSKPSEISIHILRLDPTWDPLRDHPRFQKLLESGK